MSIRKSDDRSNETDSRYSRTKDSFKANEITERFDSATDNDNKFDSAIQYLNEKVDECIDALNTNTGKTGISTAQASAITANTAKVGTTSTERSRIAANHAKVSYDKDLSDTEGKSVKITVNESRGAYSLTFTMAHGKVTKSVTIALE